MVDIKLQPIIQSISGLTKEDVERFFIASPAPPQFMKALEIEPFELVDCGCYMQRVLLGQIYNADFEVIDGGHFIKVIYRCGHGIAPTNKIFSIANLAENDIIDVGGLHVF